MSSNESESSGTEGLDSGPGQDIVSSAPKKRRLWTKQEDERLRLLVSYWGDQGGRRSNWDKIAANFEDRSSKNCRKRWFHSLDPKLRRGKWSKNEDKILKEAYDQIGPSWQRIAQLIPGRTDDQCSKRYNDVLNPAVVDRLRSWTEEEDAKLKELHAAYGPKWQKISTELPGRTGLTIRNRWKKLMRPPRAAQKAPDHTGDLGPALGDDDDASHRNNNRNGVIDNPLPFDVPGSVPGSMQGAGFPAGADASWLHMAHQPPMSSYGVNNMGGMPNNAHQSGLQTANTGNNTPTGTTPSGDIQMLGGGMDSMNAHGSVTHGSVNAHGSVPVVNYLHQGLLIPGNRRQFTLTIESAHQPPLSFLQESHQSISGVQLDQILDFAAKNRQQIVVHQHIYQLNNNDYPNGGVDMNNAGTSNAERSASNKNPSSMNIISTSTVIPSSSGYPDSPRLMRMVQPPVQPPPSNQISVHPQPEQLRSMGIIGLSPNLNALHSQQPGPGRPQQPLELPRQLHHQLHPHHHHQSHQPGHAVHKQLDHLGKPDGLSGQTPMPGQSPGIPDTPTMIAGTLTSHQLDDPDLPDSIRRQTSLVPQPPPDEFLSRPLLFEDLHNDPKFDTDEIDFLAFNPS